MTTLRHPDDFELHDDEVEIKNGPKLCERCGKRAQKIGTWCEECVDWEIKHPGNNMMLNPNANR